MTTAKLGPWAKAFSCMSVKGVLERLWTHFSLLWFADVTSDVTFDVVASEVVSGVASKLSSDEVISVLVE